MQNRRVASEVPLEPSFGLWLENKNKYVQQERHTRARRLPSTTTVSALAGLEESSLLFLVIRAVQWLHLQLSVVRGDDAVPPRFASPVS